MNTDKRRFSFAGRARHSVRAVVANHEAGASRVSGICVYLCQSVAKVRC